jgi:hypothetical protein
LALELMCCGASAGPAGGQEFSADIVSRDAAGLELGTAAKLYVANRKVRIETSAAAAEFFLIDGDAGTALFVRPLQRIFMDAKQSSVLTQLFVPIGSKDPCRQWQAAAINAGVTGAGGEWRCGRIAPSSAGDRAAVEYRVVSPDQKSSRRWIDPDLEFPVKLQGADGTTVVLEHIRIGAQAANLFDVPPGYRRFDPQALLERIKRSDVWVESQSR